MKVLASTVGILMMFISAILTTQKGNADEASYMQCYTDKMFNRKADMWYSIQCCLQQEGVYKTQDEIKSWVFNTEQSKELLEEGRRECIENVRVNVPQASHLASQFCECVDNRLIRGLSSDKSVKECAGYYDHYL